MKAWPKKLREMVVAGRRRGGSYAALAAEYEVPVGTVKAWCRLVLRIARGEVRCKEAPKAKKRPKE